MIYLDYSATTPVNKEVLDTYVKVTEQYFGNPNSLHKLGFESSKLINEATSQIQKLLHTDKQVIYTSGAVEANNLAIFGVIKKYKNRGKKIITTKLEHSSISTCMKKLESEGYIINYVSLTDDGKVDLENLKQLIDNDTILVSICSVDSETGALQDLDKIGTIVSNYPKTIFHTDATGIIGKKDTDFSKVDLVSFSAQKFYGMKGIGCLLKNNNLELEPIIYGGKSTTIYRSGTPSTALIVSLAKALRLTLDDIDKKFDYVLNLSNYTKKKLGELDGVILNSKQNFLPHIINFSVLKIKPETLLHALEQKEIYISTRTACSNIQDMSESVFELTKDEKIASHSLRISISYLTTKEEIDIFISVLKLEVSKLGNLG